MGPLPAADGAYWYTYQRWWQTLQRGQSELLTVKFYGVRGSCPCSGADYVRYGGNTACVVLDNDGEILIFDLGTGLRPFGVDWIAANPGKPLAASALVTHTHWDHIQGLPFFGPLDHEEAVLDIFGPTEEGVSFRDVLTSSISPPLFPIGLGDFRGNIQAMDIPDSRFSLGSYSVTALPVPHVGATVGYRVETEVATVAYISDHQAPPGLDTIDEAVIELCQGADLLIHDSQYFSAEFEGKSDWGHCTIEYALLVAEKSDVSSLALFHHDPLHSDGVLDLVAESVAGSGEPGEMEVFVAFEGAQRKFGNQV